MPNTLHNVRVLRSGKRIVIGSLSAPPAFDFLALVREVAETPAPPLSVEQDLGPNPLPVADSSLESKPTAEPLGSVLHSTFTDPPQSTSFSAPTALSTPVFPSSADVPAAKPPSSLSEPSFLSEPSLAGPSAEGHSVSIAASVKCAKQKWHNSKRNARRQKAKLAKQADAKRQQPGNRMRPSKRTLTKVIPAAKPLNVDYAAEELEAAKGAHTGKMGSRKDEGSLRRLYHLRELISMGFQHIKWDGVTPIPILDRHGRVIAVLCGRPIGQDDYVQEMYEAFDAMIQEGDAAQSASKEQGCHRRGSFPAYNAGVVMGMGSRRPVALNNGAVAVVLNRLIGHKGVQRMAAFQDSCFSLWAPRLYEVYEATVKTVYAELPDLPKNFPGVFTAAAFNFGGNVWTFKHRDFFNWPFGWCFITALGRFDPRKGGQLILWELELVVDFPHAATVAIPSAVITHSNIPVRKGHQRTSFTQYSAGPIFRWVENGCQTESRLKETDRERYIEMVKKKPVAYLERVKLYSKLEELVEKMNVE